jgi:hypothetical protein
MTLARHRPQTIATVAAVAAWAVFYLVVITTAPPSYDPATESAARIYREFALLLAVPATLWAIAARLVVHHWWSRHGIHLAGTDMPGRLLAAAMAVLPVHRREWGAAMTAELAEVHGRHARWRFALSAARTAVWAPRSGAWPVPAPALLVGGGVAVAITVTVIFLRRDPTAAEYLSPLGTGFLTAILVGCLWIAVVTSRSLGTRRLAPYVGAGVALVYVAGLLLLIRAAYNPLIEAGVGDPATMPAQQQQASGLALLWLTVGLAVACFLAALMAGLIDRSFRAGLLAGIWAGILILPLAYAVWLHEALRLYPVNGGLLFFGDGAPEGENLSAALTWVLGVPPALGLPFGAIGAGLGARIRRRTVSRAARVGDTISP